MIMCVIISLSLSQHTLSCASSGKISSEIQLDQRDGDRDEKDKSFSGKVQNKGMRE